MRNFFKMHRTDFIKSMAGLCSIAMLGGCGNPHFGGQDGVASMEGKDFSSMLQGGRRVSYQLFQPKSLGLALTYLAENPTVATILDDNGSKYTGFESYDTTKMTPVSEEDLASYAVAQLEAKSATLGVETDELVKSPQFITRVSDRLLMVNFTRTFRGIKVRDAYVQLVFNRKDDGSLVLRELVNRSFGPITLANDAASEADEADIAQLTPFKDFTTLRSERLILPRETAQGDYQFFMATEYKVTDTADNENYVVTLADGPAQLLEAYAMKTSVTSSMLTGAVYDRNYLGASSNKPMIKTTMTLSGNKVVTDLDGNFAFPGAESGTFTLSDGREEVHDENKTLVQMNLSLTDTAQQVVTPSASDMIKLNPFIAVQRENQFVRRHLTPTQVPFLDQVLTINVNTTGVCNSFFNPDDESINLFKQGSQNGQTCANTALIDDVVYHEWGHALDNATGNPPGISDAAFSEGIADTMSGYIVNDFNLGIGFYLNDSTPIRLLKNTKKYPADKGNDPHVECAIISGALWDMRAALMTRYGAISGAYKAEELFLKHLLTTNNYTDSYQAMLRLDDVAGNPAVNSPNHCLINAAFAAHGLATAEGCQDPPVVETLPLDSKIALAVNSEDANGVIFMAAAENTAASAVLCLKDRSQCTADDSANIALSLEGTENNMNIFLAKTAVKISDQQLVTVIVKDAAQKVLGARTTKFASK